ncbi:MAG: mechanosensitive ion channel protein, partial [Comamonadaceae bacterium]
MDRTLMLDDLGRWAEAFLRPTVLVELGALVACVGLAWMLVSLLQRGLRQGDPRSILFGTRVLDGALFPLVLLSLAYVARTSLMHWVTLAVFTVAIPVLVSLVVIRIGVKVLQVAYPDARWVRPIERSISWMAWLGMVLW